MPGVPRPDVRSAARAVLVLSAVLASLAGCRFAERRTERASTRLRALFEEAWETRLREDPLFATRVGDPRYDRLLPEVGEEAAARRLAQHEAFLERARSIDRDALPPESREHLDIFVRQHEDAAAELRFKSWLIPITNRGGFHISFPRLPEEMPLETVEDHEDYIARLRAFEDWARAHIEVMRQGIATDRTLPHVVLEGWRGSVAPHVVDDPRESRLWRPFEELPASFPDPARERLRKEARRAIRDSVVPGYRVFLEFMEEEYLPAARKTIAARDLPDGAAFYRHRVQRFTTLELTPDEVHAMGMREVERIRAEMEEVRKRAGFEGSFDEFLEFLRSDDRFYAASAEELLEHVAMICKRIDGKLPRLFRTLPRTPYGLEPVPDYIAPKTTSAYYDPPAGDGTRAGTYFLNTYDLRARPLYEMQALALHEAVPGHHLQIALQQELEGLPEFRRFAGFTAFVEGWALYAERLGLEAGFYRDPYSDFGRLTYEMWRACRLVVDTGIHWLGWSRDQAIEFLERHTALTRLNIRNEVDRYIAWPGQALAYKVGEMRIRELRREAEEALGDRFDIRAFHDAVLLGGSVPLDILESRVRAWITSRREPPGDGEPEAPGEPAP